MAHTYFSWHHGPLQQLLQGLREDVMFQSLGETDGLTREIINLVANILSLNFHSKVYINLCLQDIYKMIREGSFVYTDLNY